MLSHLARTQDVPIEIERMRSWTREQAEAYFASGGADAPEDASLEARTLSFHEVQAAASHEPHHQDGDSTVGAFLRKRHPALYAACLSAAAGNGTLDATWAMAINTAATENDAASGGREAEDAAAAMALEEAAMREAEANAAQRRQEAEAAAAKAAAEATAAKAAKAAAAATAAAEAKATAKAEAQQTLAAAREEARRTRWTRQEAEEGDNIGIFTALGRSLWVYSSVATTGLTLTVSGNMKSVGSQLARLCRQQGGLYIKAAQSTSAMEYAFEREVGATS